jgi:hypothetical protein
MLGGDCLLGPGCCRCLGSKAHAVEGRRRRAGALERFLSAAQGR